ncbi:hypothetical protein AXF42_Ash016189 [Apostasia shenzhenica]|uniref:Uncharacterized protein n=1 Tax=Apostasia shenzhenica TaxID=1088818 RepID=A0A2I0AEN7_9ASPA|nr:hypothetical protein AXF42_Ash016189 [Apostasia shenzhenica]
MAFGAGGDVEHVPYIGWDYSCDFEVDYKSQDRAAIVFAALDVDKELQPEKVKRQIHVSDGKLKVRFESVEARFLRASFSAFVDLLILATKLIEEYDQSLS